MKDFHDKQNIEAAQHIAESGVQCWTLEWCEQQSQFHIQRAGDLSFARVMAYLEGRMSELPAMAFLGVYPTYEDAEMDMLRHANKRGLVFDEDTLKWVDTQ